MCVCVCVCVRVCVCRGDSFRERERGRQTAEKLASIDALPSWKKYFFRSSWSIDWGQKWNKNSYPLLPFHFAQPPPVPPVLSWACLSLSLSLSLSLPVVLPMLLLLVCCMLGRLEVVMQCCVDRQRQGELTALHSWLSTLNLPWLGLMLRFPATSLFKGSLPNTNTHTGLHLKTGAGFAQSNCDVRCWFFELRRLWLIITLR